MEQTPTSGIAKPRLWIRLAYVTASLVALWGVALYFDWLASPAKSTRIWYCVAGLACLLLLHAWSHVPGGAEIYRWPRRALSAVLMLLAVGAFVQSQRTLPLFLRNQIAFPVNVFHYYVGAKYFDELGYQDLYRQTVAADLENEGRLRSVRIVRDLRDYRNKRTGDFSFFTRSDRFSEERWTEFTADIEFFTRHYPTSYWSMILRDRGYNPTPFWNTVGSTLTNALDIKKPGQRRLLLGLDPLLALLACGACVWAFGPATTSMLMLLFFLAPINEDRLVGGLLVYDWFYAMLAGLALFRKQRWYLSAACWAYAIMTRAFPLLLVFTLSLSAVIALVRTRRINPGHARFLLATAGISILFLALGCFNAMGLRSWVDFGSNISVHNEHHQYGIKRSGLGHFFTHELGKTDGFENAKERIEVFERQRAVYYGSATVMLLMLGWTLRRKTGVDALVWGVPLFFVLMVSSRYYFSVFVFLVLLGAEKARDRPSLAGGLFGFVFLICWYLYAGGVNNDYAHYVHGNLLAAVGLVLLMGSAMIQDRLGHPWKTS